MRKVEVRINEKGEVETNFIGFVGDECLVEAEKLRLALAAMGLEAVVREAVGKDPAVIAAELSDDEEDTIEKKRGVARGGTAHAGKGLGHRMDR